MTDGSGSTVANYSYSAYGRTLSASGSFSASNHFRFMGGLGVWDNLDGTLSARARTYAPALGCFVSRDPLLGNKQDPRSLNRYVFGLCSPYGYSDPSGLIAAAIPDYGVAGSTPMMISQGGGASQLAQLHLILDVAGLVEGFGTVADLANAAIYLLEGDFKNAGLAGSSAIPVYGIGATTVRLAKYADGLPIPAAINSLNPNTIRFSHDSIKAGFQNTTHGTIDDLAAGLRNGTIKPSSIEPIRLIEREGNLISIDNRRLEAFRRAGVDVPTRMATPAEIQQAIQQDKFSAGDLGGSTIRVRGQ